MKKTIISLFLLSLTIPAFSYNNEDADPVKKKAALVRMINNSLTETQAILLEESLLRLSINDLNEIYDKNEDYQSIVEALEERQPDDENGLTSGSLNK
jgi:hypothetical protein